MKPKIGQKVRLKRAAWSNLPPYAPEQAQSWLSAHALTHVSENLGYEDDPIYQVNVDCPLMNQYLLDISMFDLLDPSGK